PEIPTMTSASMPSLRLALVLASLATVSSAQNFNLDVGTNTTYPVPPATYAAAAGQTGLWQSIPPFPGFTSLVDVNGAITAAGINCSAGMDYENTNNLSGASIPDRNLLADISDPGPGTAVWTISGLLTGTYDIYTYAIAPDLSVYRTNVSVSGSTNPMQTVGGAWTGAHAQGVSYAKHRVSVSGGNSVSVFISVTAPPTGPNPNYS